MQATYPLSVDLCWCNFSLFNCCLLLFCRLKKGLTPKIRALCIVILNKRVFVVVVGGGFVNLLSVFGSNHLRVLIFLFISEC